VIPDLGASKDSVAKQLSQKGLAVAQTKLILKVIGEVGMDRHLSRWQSDILSIRLPKTISGLTGRQIASRI
jgi:asparagine synthetase A